jgi:hypothetical protein
MLYPIELRVQVPENRRTGTFYVTLKNIKGFFEILPRRSKRPPNALLIRSVSATSQMAGSEAVKRP